MNIYETFQNEKSFPLQQPPCAVAFPWWGIAYLSDQDSYAIWSFYTPVRASQVRQFKG